MEEILLRMHHANLDEAESSDSDESDDLNILSEETLDRLQQQVVANSFLYFYPHTCFCISDMRSKARSFEITGRDFLVLLKIYEK